MNYNRKRKNDLIFFSDIKQTENVDWLIEQEDNFNTAILKTSTPNFHEINKAIIILYLDGNSHIEISKITGISKTNVGTRISRIKEQIKKITITKK